MMVQLNNQTIMLSKAATNNFKSEVKKCSYVLEDDMAFPKATVNPKLLKLQKLVTEFVTSVILKHEKEFGQLIDNHCPTKRSEVLGVTNPSIIEMITQTTNIFYNKLYYQIQNKINTDTVNLILEMCEYADYGPHILLDKLIRLTLEIHLDIWRECLVMLDQNGDDLYEKSVLIEINEKLLSLNLLHILSKGINEDEPFINIPDDGKAFDIVIDKNICDCN